MKGGLDVSMTHGLVSITGQVNLTWGAEQETDFKMTTLIDLTFNDSTIQYYSKVFPVTFVNDAFNLVS